MFDKALTRRVPGDYDRRWLCDDYFDLIVWYSASGAIFGFQLCYDKPRWERALTWISTKGFSHMQVDDGEQNAYANQTPVLVPDGSFPTGVVVSEFRRRGAELPIELRELVLHKIDEYVRTRKV
ncbi:MAG TPA: hypothetical protein VGU64_22060 [Terriglobales bacterium]|jgi:hypothetical protein|nr:hypothetical protein [Terriglobales bacterium]